MRGNDHGSAHLQVCNMPACSLKESYNMKAWPRLTRIPMYLDMSAGFLTGIDPF